MTRYQPSDIRYYADKTTLAVAAAAAAACSPFGVWQGRDHLTRISSDAYACYRHSTRDADVHRVSVYDSFPVNADLDLLQTWIDALQQTWETADVFGTTPTFDFCTAGWRQAEEFVRMLIAANKIIYDTTIEGDVHP